MGVYTTMKMPNAQIHSVPATTTLTDVIPAGARQLISPLTRRL